MVSLFSMTNFLPPSKTVHTYLLLLFISLVSGMHHVGMEDMGFGHHGTRDMVAEESVTAGLGELYKRHVSVQVLIVSILALCIIAGIMMAFYYVGRASKETSIMLSDYFQLQSMQKAAVIYIFRRRMKRKAYE